MQCIAETADQRYLKSERDRERILEYFGEDRQVAVSRELTKIHEETIRGTVRQVLTHFENQTVKGEIVITISGKK